MKRIAAYATAVLLGAFAAVPAHAQKKVTFGHQQVFDLAPVLLAQDKGFFAKHGIEVALKPIPLNSQNPAALEAGEVDIAMPTASVLLQAVNGGLDIVAVSGYTETVKDDSNFGIVVRPESNIKTPADFVGKKVGVPGLNAFLHVMFREWLTMKGVDWKKVEYVETQFPQMEGILKSGSVDAVVAIQPFMSRIIGTKTGELMSNFIRDMPAGMSITVFASKKAWADKNQDAIKAYRAGFDEGSAYAHANPDEARAIVAKFLKLPPPAVAAVSIPKFDSKLRDSNLAPWVSIMKSQGMIRGDVNLKNVIVP
ncbi:ABC transporter substrate-binding protein [Pseudorhodoplanes sp.]|uniref:ABC transporter substrate-binding protein n=1 Tax=Pseudorhodoplanes sp. TaxID=1934341 RepID=UPI002CE7C62B|nr:ABC transporter substrate-binding protein [Pseudorhodoplanes sp.]HWV55262.1 ABC transporter substrate-binding protein [Pseudorhodoplanes sp.]